MIRFPVHRILHAISGTKLPAAGWLVFLALFMCQGTANADSRVVSFISLAGTNELWTEHWEIQDTRVKSDQGLEAGFHRLLPINKGVRLADSARGIVCLFPDSRHKPAKLVNNHFSIPPQTRYLSARVAASRTPPGRWEFQLSINRSQPFDPVIITGSDGWVELIFDLSTYQNQSVDIEIEARPARSGRDSSAFIDYIEMKSAQEGQGVTPKKAGNGVVFDKEFIEFLELWRRNEEIRQQRMMDRSYLDYLYDKNGSHKNQD